MRLQDAKRKMTGNMADDDLVAFTISSDPTMFRIMYKNLYSDGVRAVVRELATNAADAHAVSGRKDVRFKVTLPNRMSPTFKVRDFGPGMSPGEITTQYNEFGRSTRRDTDDATGCLGLGSKSPFAYADSFLITSYQGGRAYAYECLILESGIPHLRASAGASGPTDEPDGFEVAVSVEPGDITEFVTKAIEVLSVFDPRPDVSGNHGFAFVDPKYLVDGITTPARYVVEAAREATDGNDGAPEVTADLPAFRYGVRQNASRYETNASRVISGNVAYQLLTSSLKRLGQKEQAILNHGVDLYLPTGTVNIVPGRESLSFNAKTEAAVTAAVRAVRAAVVEHASAGVKAAPTLWQARKAAEQLQGGALGALDIKVDLTWANGEKVGERAAPIKDERVSIDLYARDRQWHSRKRRDRYGTHRYRDAALAANNNLVFVNDLKSGYVDRVCYHLSLDQIATRAYLVGGRDAAKFLARVGADEVAVPVSTLPVPPKEARAANKSALARSRVLKFDRTGASPHSDKNTDRRFWAAVPADDVPDSGVYVVVEHYVAQGTFEANRGVSSTEIRDLLANLEKVGAEVPDVYAVRPSSKAYLQDDPDWVPLRDHVLDAVKAKTPEFRARARRYLLSKYLDYSNRVDVDNGPEVSAALSPKSPLRRLVELSHAYGDVDNGVEGFVALRRLVQDSLKGDLVAPTAEEVKEVKSLPAKVRDLYPLFHHVMADYWTQPEALLYVRAKDRARKKETQPAAA